MVSFILHLQRPEQEGMQSLLYFRYDNIQREAQNLMEFGGDRLVFEAEGYNDTAAGLRTAAAACVGKWSKYTKFP